MGTVTCCPRTGSCRSTGRFSREQAQMHHQLSARRLLPAAIGLGLLLTVVTASAAVLTQSGFGDFSRDFRSLCLAASGVDLPFYTSAFSFLTFMAWAVAGSFAMLAAYLTPSRRRWLVGSLLFLLAADDALTLHESGPHRVVPEWAFYAIYAAFGLYLLAGVVRNGIDDVAVAFGVGIALLAVSAGIDEAFKGLYIVEDAPKLLGVLVWVTVPLLSLQVRPTPGPLPETGPGFAGSRTATHAQG